ncbi:VOC family protein [Bacteroidota bacterium]
MKYLKLKNYVFAIVILALLNGCKMDKQKSSYNVDQYSYNLGVVGGFCELIDAGVKQLALSAPLSPKEMDDFIIDAEKIASKHYVSIYRETDLIVTDLFPKDIALNKDVLLLFTGTTMEEYLSLKTDIKKLEDSGKYSGKARMEIAKRFGRMLSYSPRKINLLLAQNTSFRTMNNFGIRASNLFLYYKDLEAASEFYSTILGMELVADYNMAKIYRMAFDSYLILVDAEKGMHTAEEPKTVALALLTDQLGEWYEYLKGQNVNIRNKYSPRDGGPHDGFVITDPEGYLLEFEEFKQHPENERFIPILTQNKTITSPAGHKKNVPDGLGFHSTITWLYYKNILAMENYYQDVLGLEIVVDQGWAKVYKVTDTGYIGLVDEKRGMHKFTEKKAVNVSFIIDDIESWFQYVKENKLFELRSKELGIDPEGKYKAFVGYDPEGYYLEFDTFYPHNDNSILLKYLNAEKE